MIQINLVARIAEDKNSFLDLIFAAFKLKEEGMDDFNFLFIGEVLSIPIFQNIVRMAELLNVTDKISFTKKSVLLSDLPPAIKNGYFLNFTVGAFVGYSGIESVNNGFKTIFYNCDKRVTNEVSEYVNVCPDIFAVINLIKQIAADETYIQEQIEKSNLKLKNTYKLDDKETSFLLSLMLSNKFEN